jgi:hypothetical protein
MRSEHIDRSAEISRAISVSRLRGAAARLHYARDLITNDPTLARAVIEDVARDLGGGIGGG